jgi:hypothetical protein
MSCLIRCAAVLAFLLWSPFPAHAQSSTAAHKAEFYPFLVQGDLVGCQIAFTVIRSDNEYSAGKPVLVDGLLLFQGLKGNAPGAMIRLGVGTVVGGEIRFAPPSRAFLMAGFNSNAQDAGGSFLSDSPGFRGFVFGLGERTAAAIGQFMGEGVLRFAYGLPNTSVDAPVAVDFSTQPSVFADWVSCMRQVVADR